MQETLQNEKEVETEIKPYRVVKSRTDEGLLEKVNESYKLGYVPMGEEPIECVDGFKWFLRNSETRGLLASEKETRIQIIDLVEQSELYLYNKKSLLEDRENYILMNTNWDEVNKARVEDGLTKITNDKLRTAFVNEDDYYSELKEQVEQATAWLVKVKKYEALHELPHGKTPWELEAEKLDEQANQVEVVKVGEEDAKEES